MTAITYSVAGVPLDDAAGRWSLRKGTLVWPALSLRTVDTVIPGVDGSLPGGYEPVDVPSLVLRMKVSGATYGALRANVGALLSVLAPSGDVPVVQTIDGVSRSITGRGKSTTEPEFSPAQLSASFTATLRLPGVYWRGPSADWSQSEPTPGALYEVSSLAGCSAPVSDALVLVTGPVASPKVSDAAGSWAQLALTLAAGEKALLDCDAWTVRRGSGVTFEGGGTDTRGSLVTSGGPYALRLTPRMRAADPVDTLVQLSLSGSGMTSATALAVRARPAYLV